MKYRVIKAHETEYPSPLLVAKGEVLAIGELYVGEEDWAQWYWCDSGGLQGWVPEQLIERVDAESGRIKEDYSARELNVVVGDVMTGDRILNGWLQGVKNDTDEYGWVPLSHLVAV